MPRSPTKALCGKQAVEQMISDWAEGKRSVTLMGPYLEATRSERIKEASKTKALSLLINYPALCIPSLVSTKNY